MRRALRDLGLIFYILVMASIVTGCAQAPQANPLVALETIDSPAIPSDLRFCRPPTPPPVQPPAIREPKQVGVYANAEAEGRWKTADRLKECDRKRARLLELLEGHLNAD